MTDEIERRKIPVPHRIVAGIVFAALGLLVGSAIPEPALSAEDLAPLLAPLPTVAGLASRPRLEWKDTTIPQGATLSSLLGEWGVPPARVAEVVTASLPITNLRHLRAGTECSAGLDPDGRLATWRYELDPERTLLVHLGDDVHAELQENPFERHPEAVSREIDDSLFATLSPNGDRDGLALAVADVFAWQVDFHHDLHPGDRVEALYEVLEQDGEPQGVGRLLYAGLELSGRKLEAYLRETDDGHDAYYDADGRSLRKQFLRAPVAFGRITSGFTSHRLHPVRGGVHPHYGVDFAAPTGTPIHATADGTVSLVARGRGEGNYVVLRHPNGYETLYMHMSHFRKGIRRGQHVAQGETIGYVGQTGWATGPHVDYRMKRNGRYLDPRRAVSPPAPPLPADARRDFEAQRTERQREFERLVSEAPATGVTAAG